jgi:phenylacetate-CoA ligase
MEITPLERWAQNKLHLTGRLNLARLQEYQLRKLRETLQHVLSRSRFYKEHLKGMDPSSIQTMEDVARLPFTKPTELAARSSDFLCISPHHVSRMVTLATSGTTGLPKRLAFTPEDQERIVDFFHHGMTTLVQRSDRVVIFLPGKTEGSVGDLLKKALARFDCEGIVFGPIEGYGRALTVLLDLKPSCAVGIPSQLLALSRFTQPGAMSERVQLKSVLLSTDYASQTVVHALAQKWHCAVYDHYGATEMGLGGAVECSALSGYHMRDADLLFEIIDPITQMPAADGDYGEVVFSTLTRQGMPLIRYRTGDRSRFLAQPCPCGSVLKRMERISRRMQEPIRLLDGSFLSITQLDDILLRDPCVLAYSAEISRQDGCDCLVLTIQSVRNPIDSERIAMELVGNLSMGALIAQKQLKLEIREGEAGYFTTGTAKRVITDKR